jgi:hypothetical protein
MSIFVLDVFGPFSSHLFEYLPSEFLGRQLCNESQSPTISGAVRALSGAAWSTKVFNI